MIFHSFSSIYIWIRHTLPDVHHSSQCLITFRRNTKVVTRDGLTSHHNSNACNVKDLKTIYQVQIQLLDNIVILRDK